MSEEIDEIDGLEFAGYAFKTKDELEMAKKEAAGIKHINTKINYEDGEALLNVYNKLIDRDLFKTVVGVDFLRNIRKILLEQYGYSIKELKSVPIASDIVNEKEKQIETKVKHSVEKKTRNKPKKNKRIRRNVEGSGKSFAKPFFISIVIIIVLVIFLIMETIIFTNSENLNILNYKNRLDRQYQSWEEDLTQRERILNEKLIDIGN